jgi:hypothetical protein
MSDTLVAKGSDSKFKPHIEGQFVGQCVDTIDLGDSVETFANEPTKLVHKCAIVFLTGEKNDQTGELVEIAREFTVSMGERANLRKFLEQWRGRKYTPEQIEEGVPLHKLTGNHAQITVEHKTSGAGRTYGNISACVGVMPQLKESCRDYTKDYKRADFWEQKKKDYAEGARKFRSEQSPSAPDDFGGFPDNDDDLPF